MKTEPHQLQTLLRLPAFLLVLFLLAPAAGCALIPADVVQTWPTTPQPTTTSLDDAEIVSSHLLITEVMSSNQSTLRAIDQTSPDWIEIHNAGTSAINLDGYCLSDNLKKPDQWTFPDITLAPGGYLLVFASGEKSSPQAQAAGEIHASFRLDAKGDELVLVSPAGQLLARLTLPELPPDISIGLEPGSISALDSYYYFNEATPGFANGTDGRATIEGALSHPQVSLVCNEYMTRNDRYPTADGSLPDWIEMQNTGKSAISLLGFQLSDDPDQPGKWVFPDITAEAGDLILVWLSGQEKAWDPAEPDSLHASFRLGKNDRLIQLSDAQGNVVFRQAIEDLPANISKGRSVEDPDVWQYYPMATPGKANTTAGFAGIDGAMSLKHRGVWINEVMAESAVLMTGGVASQADWIELYNGTSQVVSLDGYGLSDDPEEPFRMLLSGYSIQPDGYLVVEPVGFGLSTADETICLTRPDNTLSDVFATGDLRSGISSGRGNTRGDEPADIRFFYLEPTRGAPNSTAALAGIALMPEISVTASDGSLVGSLYFDGSVQVSLSSTQRDAVIRYTLDGSLPSSASTVYAGPLTVSANQVIRCHAELAGSLPSDVASRTLLSETRHDLPVLSIAVNPADFTGPAGVWADSSRQHEAAIQASFYEQNGTLGVSFNAGIACHGAYSRTEIQKSLELNLRAYYGDSQVTYPFFPGNEISTFKRLILRTSGQDWKFTKLRDAFMSELIEDDLAVDTMDWRPCVLYVNGEYYGLYEIREHIDEHYLAAHHGIDQDNIDIIKGNAIVLEGSMSAYQSLMTYVRNHDLTQEDAYQHVLSWVDEQSLMDWIIAQTFFNNLDSGNKKFWREKTDGAEWHWTCFDLDWGLFPTTYKLNILKNDLLDPAGHGQQNYFDSTLQVKLMENPEFRTIFIERYAELLNTVFQTENMLSLFDSMYGQIKNEMPRQISRWGIPATVPAWESNVSVLRNIISEKRGRMITSLQQTFGLPDTLLHDLFPEDFQ